MTIDVRTEGGREVFRRLAERMDVVIENFRPGTLDGLGLGYDDLRALNPRLVYCSISGMGSSGPYRDRPTYDAIAQAISGMSSQFTETDDPKPAGPPLADQLTGIYAAYGILAALVARSNLGFGQRLEVSMLSSCLAFLTNPVADYLLAGDVSGPQSRPRRSQSYAFVAGDGLPFVIHLSSPPKFWEALTEVVGRPDLRYDPRFSSKSARIEHYDELHRELSAIFRSRPREEWLLRLGEADVPAAPLYTVPEALSDPQVQHLAMVQTFGAGDRTVPLVGFPVFFAETPCRPGLPPPELGEHTDAVLRDLGYDQTEITRLRAEGAV